MHSRKLKGKSVIMEHLYLSCSFNFDRGFKIEIRFHYGNVLENFGIVAQKIEKPRLDTVYYHESVSLEIAFKRFSEYCSRYSKHLPQN